MKIKNNLGLSQPLWICFIAVILLVCNSCKMKIHRLKTDYQITFKRDGIAEDFTQLDTCQLTWDRSGNPAMEDLSIRGSKIQVAFDFAPAIELSLVSSDSISTGTYTDSSSNGAYSLYADYIPNPHLILSAANIYMAGYGVYIDGIQKGVQLSHHLTLTITSISNGTIKGTFSGDFYEYDGDIRQAKIMSITDGYFKQKIQ